jgi:hypothetical protein
VRALFGDLDVERARAEIWDALRDDLDLPEQPPPPLDPAHPQD